MEFKIKSLAISDLSTLNKVYKNKDKTWGEEILPKFLKKYILYYIGIDKVIPAWYNMCIVSNLLTKYFFLKEIEL